MLKSFISSSSRELCNFVNNSGIKKEDIISVIWTNGSYSLLYWE